jgi:hypothetical protein
MMENIIKKIKVLKESNSLLLSNSTQAITKQKLENISKYLLFCVEIMTKIKEFTGNKTKDTLNEFEIEEIQQ